MDLKTKEEKDAELDRRIEALRKKNEALVKRYQVRSISAHTQNVSLVRPITLGILQQVYEKITMRLLLHEETHVMSLDVSQSL